jgi:MFS family permease
MSGAAELASKVLGVLAAILGLTGYVLVLGAAILWLRLSQAGLPTTTTVSLADHSELIVIGAQAVAVWVAFLAVLGVLSAWIVTGDPNARRFGYPEAGLSLSITLATLFALDSTAPGLLALPVIAALIAGGSAITAWPSREGVASVWLPVVVAGVLGGALSLLGGGNEVASSTGAVIIFALLVAITPALQGWRAGQGANRAALANVGTRAEQEKELGPVVIALEQNSSEHRPASVVWIGRAAITLSVLAILGVVAVTSQVDKHKDFHKVLIGLTNGDCVEGTFLARNSEQLIVGQPKLGAGEAPHVRVSVIPVKEVLEVQVFAKAEEGTALSSESKCGGNTEVLVRPPAPAANSG